MLAVLVLCAAVMGDDVFRFDGRLNGTLGDPILFDVSNPLPPLTPQDSERAASARDAPIYTDAKRVRSGDQKDVKNKKAKLGREIAKTVLAAGIVSVEETVLACQALKAHGETQAQLERAKKTAAEARAAQVDLQQQLESRTAGEESRIEKAVEAERQAMAKDLRDMQREMQRQIAMQVSAAKKKQQQEKTDLKRKYEEEKNSRMSIQSKCSRMQNDLNNSTSELKQTQQLFTATCVNLRAATEGSLAKDDTIKELLAGKSKATNENGRLREAAALSLQQNTPASAAKDGKVTEANEKASKYARLYRFALRDSAKNKSYTEGLEQFQADVLEKVRLVGFAALAPQAQSSCRAIIISNISLIAFPSIIPRIFLL